MLPTPDGLRLSWLEPSGDGHALRTSILADAGWSKPVTVVESADLVANWADTPNMVLAGDGSVVVSYPKKSGAGTYAYDVELARSEDGIRWAPLGSPHDDGTETEHGFTSFVAEGNGFRAFWLDGRLTASGGPMTLRTAVWDGKFSKSSVVDERVCDCCGTSASLTSDGWMVAYRDRSDAEIRDTRVATSTGTTSVAADGWQMPGCPVNGPRVVRVADGEIVAWTTGADGTMEVRVAARTKGSFGPAQVLAAGADNPAGRVDLVVDGPTVYATWLGADAIWGRRLTVVAGRVHSGPPARLADAEAARATGFPRTALRGPDLVTVWTGPDGLELDRHPVTALAGPLEALAPVGGATVEPITRRPELSGHLLSGESWSLQATDRPVFVTLWASWCGPCRSELAALQMFARNNPDVHVVVVAVDDEAAAVKRVAKDRPGTWVTATRKDVQRAFRTTAIPASWMFNRDGTVGWQQTGPLDRAATAAALQSVP